MSPRRRAGLVLVRNSEPEVVEVGKVVAGITTSVDGYVAGPDDGPDAGLGRGGEDLHAWVFGGPWTYDDDLSGRSMEPDDQAWMEEAMAGVGAVVTGRWTYECAGHWGDQNPWGLDVFVVTHRPEEQPEGDAFRFVEGVEEAVAQAREAADGKDVHVMGGASVIRQALAAGLVDELTIILAPLVLGGGTRLFDGFDRRVDLRHKGVRQSRYATFVDYEVLR